MARMVDCPDCDGMGDFEGQLQGRELMICKRCNGTGQVHEKTVARRRKGDRREEDR